MEDDPLGFDPLSAPSTPAPSATSSTSAAFASKETPSSAASWARHDLFREPFSDPSAPWASTPSLSPPPPPTPPPSSHPLPIPTATSLSRERTSSTTAILQHSSSSSWDASAATPRQLDSPFSTRFNADVNSRAAEDGETDLSSTPSAKQHLHHGHGHGHGHQRVNTITTSLPPRLTTSLEERRKLIFTAAATGDLLRLQLLFSTGDNELEDDSPVSPTDETPSAFVQSNYTNSDGESPLHLAAYRGHLEVIKYLEDSGASVDQQDHDGWTPLHNAASRGFLDIVSWLVDEGGASVDRQSKRGYTALMNAASRGHLPIIKFLILKHQASPFLRNEFGETAFDLAASVFEADICDVLSAYEASLSPPSTTLYNPLTLHTTVPILVHENQRLARPTLKTLSLGTLSNRQPIRWSSKALSRNDGRSAYTIPVIPGREEERDFPLLRNEVGLPVIGKEDQLVVPSGRQKRSGGKFSAITGSVAEGKRHARPPRTTSASSALTAVLGGASSTGSNTPSNTPSTPQPSSSTTSPFSPPHSPPSSQLQQPAWFWLSDWTLDLTSQTSSHLDGWSYASSFDAPPEEWSSEPPEELRHLLDSGGAIGFGGKKWVRRRRWVRIMRRRLDIKDWGFGGAEESSGKSKAVEMVSPSSTTTPEPSQEVSNDYLLRAQFLVGSHNTSLSSDQASIHSNRTTLDKLELRKVAARLERAVGELRVGTLSDEDVDRRRRAEDQMQAWVHQLVLIREELGDEEESEDGEDSDDEFIYSGRDADPDDDARSTYTTFSNPGPRSPSIISGRSSFSSASHSAFSPPPPLLSSQSYNDVEISRAPDFRVPTHEIAVPVASPPVLGSTNGNYGRQVPIWEPDEVARECRRCGKGFSFFLRKHHCRRCGQVVCGSCSPYFDTLDASTVVKVPSSVSSDDPWHSAHPFKYRTCTSCHAALSLPTGIGSGSLLTTGAYFPPPSSNGGSTSPSDRSEASEVSELSDCPVCGTILATLGPRGEQEAHIKDCLETGGGSIATNGRYLVFKLPPGPLVEEECKICFCEFEVGDKLARLPCLCVYHQPCIRAWLDRGKDCPFHASRHPYQ